MNIIKVKKISARMIAVFIERSMDVLGAGAIAGVAVFQSIFMAGILGVAVVAKSLARAYIEDGKVSDKEIEDAFKESLKTSKTTRNTKK